VGDVLRVKIYYEDTDCGGVVYYANYLRYFERARTEFLEDRGVDLGKLTEEGVTFVVAEATVKYLAPGRYGDILSVETRVEKAGPASIVFGHRVLREETGEHLATAVVRLGCLGPDMRPSRMRSDIMEAIGKIGE
jgi:acyl-CoA thioester hydrolase